MTPRRAAFALVAAALALVVVAASGELLARAAGHRPFRGPQADDAWSAPHSLLGWINREGTSRSNEAGAVAMTFWSGGRRASRPARDAPAGPELEVALVGGSWFQGYGVADDETFAWQLGRRFPHVRFDNFGTGGYGTLQAGLSAELAVAEGRLAPALVVYGFATFHAMRNVQTYTWLEGLRARSGHRLVPPRAEIVEGALVRHPPVAALPDWPLERRSALVATLHESAYRRALRERDAWAEPVTRRLVRDLDRSVRDFPARLLVAILYGDDDEIDRYVDDWRRHAIAHVDCRVPGDPWQPGLRVGGTGHPNAIAHAHWARCLGDWLVAQPPGGVAGDDDAHE